MSEVDTYLATRLEEPEFAAGYQDAEEVLDLLEALVRQRRSQQLTQQQVAAAMGTTQSAISELERAESDPRVSTLMRYARAVGTRLQLAAGELAGQRQVVGMVTSGLTFTTGKPFNYLDAVWSIPAVKWTEPVLVNAEMAASTRAYLGYDVSTDKRVYDVKSDTEGEASTESSVPALAA